MYYLYTVWSGCPDEIFSMVSLSNYTLCILFLWSFSFNVMNDFYPKLIPITQLFLNFIKKKTTKQSFRLYKKKLYYGKYPEPYNYKPR